MNIDITGLSKSELIELHRMIGDRIHYLSEQENLTHLSKFKLGDIVYIQNGNSLCGGIVTKVNQKTLTIQLTTGEVWRVSPSIVKKATSPNKELLKLKEEFLNPQDHLLNIPEISRFFRKQGK
jgi:uncharacterized protein YkvS